jgi:hypothetical protein
MKVILKSRNYLGSWTWRIRGMNTAVKNKGNLKEKVCHEFVEYWINV